MFVYKQLHPAAAIICAVATLTIAPDAAPIPIPSPMTPTKIAPAGNMPESAGNTPESAAAMPIPAVVMPESTAISSATIPIPPEPHLIPPEPHLVSSESRAHPVRVHSKVGFVARNSDCQACNNDCKPRNHYFPPRNQNKHHLHPCRKGLSLCCMGGDGDEGNGCGAAIGLCISFVLTNSSYLYNIVA